MKDGVMFLSFEHERVSFQAGEEIIQNFKI